MGLTCLDNQDFLLLQMVESGHLGLDVRVDYEQYVNPQRGEEAASPRPGQESLPMSTRHAQLPTAGLPSPFPEGWYFVTSRKALQKVKFIEKTWMGEEIVVWCDENGGLCVAEAFCPHLGSYLGPTAGGRIRENRLVCPFHGYEYDITGQCVATPYADPPRNAQLRVFRTREILGLIFAWWGIGGREPQ